jgi:hypothetical protein
MTQEQKYGRDANLAPSLLDGRIDWEKGCDYSTLMTVVAMYLRLVDNCLHWGTRRGMKDLIEELHSCRMVLMLCGQKEQVREIYVVPGSLKATTCLISVWKQSLWRPVALTS